MVVIVVLVMVVMKEKQKDDGNLYLDWNIKTNEIMINTLCKAIVKK